MAQSLAQRVAQHDREIAAIRKLVFTGMKMLVRLERNQDRAEGEHEVIRQELRQLAAEGRETRRLLNGLMRSLERGGNGRGSASH